MPVSPLSQTRALLPDMTSRDLRALSSAIKSELASRATENEDDAETLSRKAMQSLFSETSVAGPMQVAPGLIALGGMIQEQGGEGSNRHKCQLFTIFPEGEESSEVWAWDEGLESMAHSDTAKVGRVRHSVAIHAATEGMIVVRHRMSSDGMRHARSSVTAWRISQVLDDGKVIIEQLDKWIPANLPPPHSGGSTAASAGRLVRRG